MKKYFVLTVVSAALIFTISSCSKTGPAGPLSTGSLEGYVTILDPSSFSQPGQMKRVERDKSEKSRNTDR